jgi:hypothetical protein
MNLELARLAPLTNGEFHFPRFLDNPVTRRERHSACARHEQKRERGERCGEWARTSVAQDARILPDWKLEKGEEKIGQRR